MYVQQALSETARIQRLRLAGHTLRPTEDKPAKMLVTREIKLF